MIFVTTSNIEIQNDNLTIFWLFQSKNKRRKKKKKTRAARKAEEKRLNDARQAELDKQEGEGDRSDSGIEVEYVQEQPAVDVTNPFYSQFHKIFETFKVCPLDKV